MKYKHQILSWLWHCILFVLVFLWFIYLIADVLRSPPKSPIYSVTSQILFFLWNFTGFELIVCNIFFEGLFNTVKKKYPQLNPMDFDYYSFQETHNTKLSRYIIQPLTCLIVCSPFVWYFITYQYELKIIFGVLANIALILFFIDFLYQRIRNRFLFARKVDGLIENQELLEKVK